LIARLKHPENYYEFTDPKKANAVLMSLCQEAADALASPVQEPVQPVALEGGKRLIVVDQSFDDLMYWLGRCEDKGHLENCHDLVEPWSAFQYENYTTPPAAQRQWVGLTDEEMNEAMGYWSEDSRSAYGGAHAADGEYVCMISTWRYIEAKLKEKNNG
jgi:hypothetical protein